MAASCALFSGFSRFLTVPAGSLAKAWSVGANTVNGPGPSRVAVSPAALIAAVNVLNWPAATAVLTMSLSAVRAKVLPAAKLTPTRAAAAILATRDFIARSPRQVSREPAPGPLDRDCRVRPKPRGIEVGENQFSHKDI